MADTPLYKITTTFDMDDEETRVAFLKGLAELLQRTPGVTKHTAKVVLQTKGEEGEPLDLFALGVPRTSTDPRAAVLPENDVLSYLDRASQAPQGGR